MKNISSRTLEFPEIMNIRIRTHHVVVRGADAAAGDDEVKKLGLAPHLVADFLEIIVDDSHAFQAHAHLQWSRKVPKQFMRTPCRKETKMHHVAQVAAQSESIWP